MLRPSVWLSLAFLREMLRIPLTLFHWGQMNIGRKREVWTYSEKPQQRMLEFLFLEL